MKWILILYWSLHGQIVLTHSVFEGLPACEARIAAMRGVFDYMGHDDWSAVCQPEKAPERVAGDRAEVPR